jgi:hypothetical protein
VVTLVEYAAEAIISLDVELADIGRAARPDPLIVKFNVATRQLPG